MTYEVAKKLLIELQCANKNITEQQNDALTFVISILDDLVAQCDRGNYGLERHMIKEACPEYSDKEVEAYIQGYEEKEIEIRDKIMEDKVIETGLKLTPTEVDGLYLNIPEEVKEGEGCYDLLKKCKYKFEYLLESEIENTIERDVVKKLIDKIQLCLQKLGG